MKSKKIIIIIFCILLIAPVITWPVGKLFLNPEINENKNPMKFPEFSDSFVVDLESYFLENAPYRNLSIKLNLEVSKSFGKVYYKMLDSLKIPYYQIKNDVLFGKDGWLFYTRDNTMGDYAGTNLPTEAELQSYLEKVVKVDNYFKSIGKKFAILVPPNKSQVYYEYVPNGIRVVSEIKKMDVIVEYIKEHSDVKITYCLDEMQQNKSDGQVYFKYDSHWNNFGASQASKTFFSQLGVDIGAIEYAEKERPSGDLAYMVAEDNVVDIDYDTQIELPSGKSQEKLAIVGDSFSYYMTDFVSKVFENYSIDTNSTLYGNIGYSIDAINASDIFVLESVERFSTRIFGEGALLDQLIAYYNL